MIHGEWQCMLRDAEKGVRAMEHREPGVSREETKRGVQRSKENKRKRLPGGEVRYILGLLLGREKCPLCPEQPSCSYQGFAFYMLFFSILLAKHCFI